MDNSVFAPVLRAQGPFATVYIDVRERTEDRNAVIDLRWAGILDELREKGADKKTIDALVDVVSGHSRSGVIESIGVVAAHGEVLLELHFPAEVPARASWSAVPSLLPALQYLPEPVPHVLVLVDRTRAEIHVPNGEREEVIDVDGDSPLPLRKVQAGGWSMPRYQHRAEEGWAQNARSMAAAIEDAAESVAAEVVIVAGDVRERSLVRDELLEQSRREVIVMDEGGLAPGASLDGLHAHIAEVLDERRRRHLKEMDERFGMGLSRGEPTAVEGISAVVEVVRRAQVDTLLVDCTQGRDWSLWVGDEPQHLAATEDEVRGLGSGSAHRVNAMEALVWSAIGLGSHVMCTHDVLSPRDGLGAILRFTDASTAELVRRARR